MSWFSFFKSNSKFNDNLNQINRISINSSIYVLHEEGSYENFEVDDREEIHLIITLIEQENIKIPFMGLYKSDFETKHWLIQLYTNNNSDMYIIYVDKNRIFDKESQNSRLYQYLNNKFH